MRTQAAFWMVGLGAVLGLAGCAAAENKTAPDGSVAAQSQSHAGWYMQRAGQDLFQPCGQSQQWRVTSAADLHAKAEAFGLQPDTPVYVRVTGAASADEIAVSSVDQFGSPVPVRDCAMNGVVTQAPANN